MSDRPTHAAKAAKTGRVLPFRPRTSASVPLSKITAPDTPATGSDDFGHRMLVNAAGLVCAALLTGAGIWLAVSISNLRRTQDCALTGRRDCAPIVALDRQSLPARQH